ncbi:CLASP N terminal domain-containing protein [Giardia muris]|uniref:CLASP N terminal domain-containing protein n=1 Tax=Giardia muris TaxID=5742 RepID=A0A4Z1SQH6_GIAMU|nr:CLASP N terminal domain-containing protein [Giardia muris]|eukprot:TNJ28076.1 CLASP N terminal domain-containing protein [Giardia muris]
MSIDRRQETVGTGPRRASRSLSGATKPISSVTKDTTLSIFTPPGSGDPEAQSNPLSIVPPIQQASYYSYKPLVRYILPCPPEILLNTIPGFTLQKLRSALKLDEGRMADALEPVYQHLGAELCNEATWTNQLDAVKALIGIISIEDGCNVSRSPSFAQSLTEFLLQNHGAICSCIISRRSTLSREICLFLELYTQRYGTYAARFLAELVETLIKLLNQKGVYYENSADSLLRTIIIYALPKAAFGKLVKSWQTEKSAHVKAHILEYLVLFIISGILHSEAYLRGIGNLINNRDLDFVAKFDVELVQILCRSCDEAVARTRSTAKTALIILKTLRPPIWTKAAQLLGTKAGKIESGIKDCVASYYYIIDEAPKTRKVQVDAADFLDSLLRSVCRMKGVNSMDSAYPWKSRLIDSEEELLSWERIGMTAALTSSSPPSISTINGGTGPIPRRSRPGGTSAPEIRGAHTKGRAQQSVFLDEGDENSDDLEDVEDLLAQTTGSIVGMQTKSTLQTSSARQSVTNKKTPNIDDLINSLSNPETDRAEILRTIEVWNQHFETLKEDLEASFPQLLLTMIDLISTTRHAEVDVRLGTLQLLERIILARGAAIGQMLDFFALSMLQVYEDPELLVRRAADAVLLALPRVIDPRLVFKTYASIIAGVDGVILHGSLRLLCKAAQQYEDMEVLLKDVNLVFEGLQRAFENSNPDIRKAVVYCFVDLYFLIGEDFTVYLNRLTPTQLKLVTIYVGKTSTKRARLSADQR